MLIRMPTEPFEPRHRSLGRPLTTERRASMTVMAKVRTSKAQSSNGKIDRLSAKELAEMTTPPKYATIEERRAALKRATTGLRAKVRVTRDMYRPR
jgi:hypothetical protein